MNIAIILAGGKGTRMCLDTPKQFLLINNKPLIVHTIEAFNNVSEIDYILLTCLENEIEHLSNLVKEYNLTKVKYIIKGGETRQESVYFALKTLKENNVSNLDNILIHDGARPKVSKKIILDNISGCNLYKAVVTAIKSTDSIFVSNDNLTVTNYINRNEVYNVQTPQTFKFELIYNAHLEARNSGVLSNTDDASMVKVPVHIVVGNVDNIKVTTKEDLERI